MGQLTTPNGTVRPQSGLPTERLEQLAQDGFCVIPDVVDEAVLTLRGARRGNAGWRATGDDPFNRHLIDSGGWPELADIIRNPRRCTRWSGWDCASG